MSGWDQQWDIEHLEAQLRRRDGRETLEAECEIERTRIRHMFEQAKRRLGLHNLDERGQ